MSDASSNDEGEEFVVSDFSDDEVGEHFVLNPQNESGSSSRSDESSLSEHSSDGHWTEADRYMPISPFGMQCFSEFCTGCCIPCALDKVPNELEIHSCPDEGFEKMMSTELPFLKITQYLSHQSLTSLRKAFPRMIMEILRAHGYMMQNRIRDSQWELPDDARMRLLTPPNPEEYFYLSHLVRHEMHMAGAFRAGLFFQIQGFYSRFPIEHDR